MFGFDDDVSETGVGGELHGQRGFVRDFGFFLNFGDAIDAGFGLGPPCFGAAAQPFEFGDEEVGVFFLFLAPQVHQRGFLFDKIDIISCERKQFTVMEFDDARGDFVEECAIMGDEDDGGAVVL